MRGRERGKRIGGSSATHNTAWQAINYVAENLAIKRRQAEHRRQESACQKSQLLIRIWPRKQAGKQVRREGGEEAGRYGR